MATATVVIRATELNGFYEIVVASEEARPSIEINGELLTVPENTPEGSVILIKGQPNGQEKKIFRLFQILRGNLFEATSYDREETYWIGGWQFKPETGQIVGGHNLEYPVSHNQWGYVQAIELGWDAYQHFAAIMMAAGFTYEADSLPPAESRKHYLLGFNQAIKDHQNATDYGVAILTFAQRLSSHDLLDDVSSDLKQKGHLRALANSPETYQHCAAGIIAELRELYELCRKTFPVIKELSSRALKP